MSEIISYFRNFWLAIISETSIQGDREVYITKGNGDIKFMKTLKVLTLASHLLMP